VIEIAKAGGWPQLLTKLVSANHLAPVLSKHNQNLKRLVLDFQSHPALPQLSCLRIEIKQSEAQYTGLLG
jgi:hypothetical protein